MKRIRLPITIRGVARNAAAGWLNTLACGWLSAAFFSVVLALAGINAWVPALDQLIPQLPQRGTLAQGQLQLESGVAPIAASTHHLELKVLTGAPVSTASAADLGLEFATGSFRLIGPIGYVDLPYPAWLRIPFNSTELEPWWNAWKPALAVLAFALGWGAFIMSWLVLGAAAIPLPLLIRAFSQTPLRFSHAWRLGILAFIPGSLVATSACFVYSLGFINVFVLCIAWIAHFAIALTYLIGAAWMRPACDAETDAPIAGAPGNPDRPNPFEPPKRPKKKQPRRRNPFE